MAYKITVFQASVPSDTGGGADSDVCDPIAKSYHSASALRQPATVQLQKFGSSQASHMPLVRTLCSLLTTHTHTSKQHSTGEGDRW